MASTADTFGCSQCFPPDADKAWEEFSRLQTDLELVSESHATIKIRSCADCQQKFVSVFTESVGLLDGADPQYWSVLPITLSESTLLAASGSELESTLRSLAPNRRSLCHDFPSKGGPKSY